MKKLFYFILNVAKVNSFIFVQTLVFGIFSNFKKASSIYLMTLKT